ALRGRSAELQRQVRGRAWEREGSASAAGSVVGVGELCAELRAQGTAFVGYVQHGGRWLAVLVRGRGAQVISLDSAREVDELVRRVRADLDALAMPRLPGSLRHAVEQSLGIGLALLDEMLLAPLHVEGVPLVVSPSGPLVVLPWSLLASRRALPVVVASGATAWTRSRARTRAEGPPTVAVVAGPGLHRAEDEASRVHDTWAGSSLLAGDQATTGRVGRALAEADVVHVAAHGRHQAESPLFSSIRLADGPLYAYELDAESRLAGCVVLSACEAGLSTVGPGEEGLGLTSVLLHLGAQSVLAGVANVRDDVAAEVMEHAHRSMARGVDSAAALASAQAQCAAPAPFVCFGAAW
ncbi:MAG: CHAT domain-containing protein, partial [Actinomycetota bacterium]